MNTLIPYTPNTEILSYKERQKRVMERKNYFQAQLDTLIEEVHFKKFGKRFGMLLSGARYFRDIFTLKEVVNEQSTIDHADGHFTIITRIYFVSGDDDSICGGSTSAASTYEKAFLYEYKATGRSVDPSYRSERHIEGNTDEHPDRFVVKSVNGSMRVYEKSYCQFPRKHLNAIATLSRKRAFCNAVIEACGASDMFQLEGEDEFLKLAEEVKGFEDEEHTAEEIEQEDESPDYELLLNEIMESAGNNREWFLTICKKRNTLKSDQTLKDLTNDDILGLHAVREEIAKFYKKFKNNE